MNKTQINKWAISIAILLLGISVAGALFVTRPKQPVVQEERVGRLVQTFRATPVSHRIAIKAYGTSRAASEWTAVAEVSGRITLLSPAFREGEVVEKELLIATIDRKDYDLAVKAAENDIAVQKQKDVELDQNKINLESLRELREEQRKFSQANLDRIKTLASRNAQTKAELDRASSALVDHQAALRDLTNQLELIPTQKRSVALAIEAANIRLEQAKLDLERCEMRMPYTALCISRNAELHQKVQAGQELGEFLALDSAEIVAMVEPRRAMALFPKLGELLGPIDLRSQTGSLIRELRDRVESLQIPVDVTWRAGEEKAHWRGRLTNAAATMDQESRALPLIVTIDDAFSEVQIGVKPALVPGMFVEVVIYGDRLTDVFVLPREAIRNSTVYVVRNGRLQIVDVHIAALEEQLAVVDSGLSNGDQIVLADLFPAANGMQLRIEEVPNPVTPRTKRNSLVSSKEPSP